MSESATCPPANARDDLAAAVQPVHASDSHAGRDASLSFFELAADDALTVREVSSNDVVKLGDAAKPGPGAPLRLAYRNDTRGLRLYHGDCLDFLDEVAANYPEGWFDTIFADPPYFLSNGGITCQAGRRVKVDKGTWDKSQGVEATHQFNLEWLRRCQQVLKPNGTIWVSGTLHVIFSVGHAMQQLGYRILNDITWEKPNPPPNLGCRCFTHSTETVLWAGRSESSKHTFNYQQMRELNRGKQMKTVWTITSATGQEKSLGKHPTQKPVALVERCLLASTNPGDLVLDPFLGAGTTAIAALRTGRRCVGVESDRNYVELAVARFEAEGERPRELFSAKIPAAS